MSPASLKKRKSNTQQERNKDKKALAVYGLLEVTLDDDQSDEMKEIMDKIDKVEKQTLEHIFSEAENASSGVGNSVRGIWQDDKRNMKDLRGEMVSVHVRLEIHETHSVTLFINFLTATGKKGNRWNMVTIRLGMTIYSICTCKLAHCTAYSIGPDLQTRPLASPVRAAE